MTIVLLILRRIGRVLSLHSPREHQGRNSKTRGRRKTHKPYGNKNVTRAPSSREGMVRSCPRTSRQLLSTHHRKPVRNHHRYSNSSSGQATTTIRIVTANIDRSRIGPDRTNPQNHHYHQTAISVVTILVYQPPGKAERRLVRRSTIPVTTTPSLLPPLAAPVHRPTTHPR
uniref:Putative secreted protein n=1 Tax=Anopheles darlingi TaxID=43151 RepID=A0A2M4D4W7_ANODA